MTKAIMYDRVSSKSKERVIMNQTITVNLKDVSASLFGDKQASLDFDIVINSVGIYIRPHGYGDYSSVDGKGLPIMIEFNNGEPNVIIWDDINVEDNNHNITLKYAKESRRKEIVAENNAPNE